MKKQDPNDIASLINERIEPGTLGLKVLLEDKDEETVSDQQVIDNMRNTLAWMEREYGKLKKEFELAATGIKGKGKPANECVFDIQTIVKNIFQLANSIHEISNELADKANLPKRD